MFKKRANFIVRAMFIVLFLLIFFMNNFVVFASGSNTFPDVTSDMYFYNAVESMYQQGAVLLLQRV